MVAVMVVMMVLLDLMVRDHVGITVCSETGFERCMGDGVLRLEHTASPRLHILESLQRRFGRNDMRLKRAIMLTDAPDMDVMDVGHAFCVTQVAHNAIELAFVRHRTHQEPHRARQQSDALPDHIGSNDHSDDQIGNIKVRIAE